MIFELLTPRILANKQAYDRLKAETSRQPFQETRRKKKYLRMLVNESDDNEERLNTSSSSDSSRSFLVRKKKEIQNSGGLF